MKFSTGVITGFAAALGSAALMRRAFSDPARPPIISEYFVRSVWLDLAGFYDLPANPPLIENHTRADIAIVGGGFTGLASAYNLAKRFPSKRIVLIEAARCGYGSSGRNGGILQDFDNHLIMTIFRKNGLESAREYLQVDRQGPEILRSLVREHDIDCDLEEGGVLEVAMEESHMETLLNHHEEWKRLGIDSRVLERDELNDEIKSDRYCGGLQKNLGAILNPAKLALGLKSVVESMGVEVFERTKVMSIDPGAKITIETEFGEITADSLVLATNAYSHKLGFFKNRIVPIGNYAIATEPLSDEQLDAIGWKGRESIFDTRPEFDYFRLTADNRIVIGGETSPYFYGNGLSTGNYKPTLEKLENSLFETWPQLRGLEITHKWGGTLAMTLDFHPTIGVTGEAQNIYYGTGYSGHGVSWCQLAGKIISQLYAGDETELTRFYCVNKTPPYMPPEPLRNIGLNLYKKFLL
ncbi:MAG: FAD-dependent oxidoreductase [Proteobacteria bacterium]|nr:FAD-dependent oxidoreductase [Pseudomonadota bacterium]